MISPPPSPAQHPPPGTTDWLRWWARRDPDRLVLIGEHGHPVSYRELDEMAAAVATVMERAAAGRPVGCLSDRRAATVAELCAMWRRGIVAVVVERGEPLPTLDRLHRTWGVEMLVGEPGDREPRQPEPAVPFRLADPIADRRDGHPLPALQSLVDLTQADGDPAVGTEITATADPPDTAPFPTDAHHTWVPTTGSTGDPKAVVLTHGNVAAAVAASQRRLGNGPDDRWLLVLPLFHVGGLSVLWRSFAAGGAVVLHERFDAERVAEALSDGSVTIASLVPTMLHRVLEVGPTPSPALRAVLVGGAAAAPSLLQRARAAGLPVLATYGATEACSQISTVVPGNEEASGGTVGVPLDGMTVTIVDPAGVPVPDGAAGEIVVSGPAVSPGYAPTPDRAGPHHTGDLGRWDAGRLVVLGRIDDMIVTGGENVAPQPVEAVLNSLDGVASAVVYGLTDPEWGQIVAAAVVPEAGVDLTVAELEARVRIVLPPPQRPRRWRIIDDLPLLPNGKIDRAAVARARD